MTTLSFDISEDELPIFMAEASDQLQILEEGLVRIERGEFDPELLHELFRAAHTLKGSAGMISHKRMVVLTHALETVLDGLRKQTLTASTNLIDPCLDGVDTLRVLREEIVTGEESSLDIQPLVMRLSEFTGVSAPEASSLAGGVLSVQAFINQDSIAPAARAYQVMMALQEMGEILSMEPSQAQLETGQPVGQLTATFIPNIPVDEVRKALIAISEIDRLNISGEVINLQPPAPQAAFPVPKGERLPLGETLVKNGLITADQLQVALHQQAAQDGPALPLGQALVKMGAINQEVLDEVLAEQIQQKQDQQAPSEGNTPDHAPGRPIEKIIRTNVERLDNLMNLVGELITDRNRLNQLRGQLQAYIHSDDQVNQLDETMAHIGRITDQLQAEVMQIRMLPIANVFHKFPRMVRDLARTANKQIDLVIRGEETELDRSVIEFIHDPLIHLIRNSVDHGIESPEDRCTAGKPERGIISMTACHEQGRIVLTIEDDGHGINIDTVKAKAVEKGLITPAEAANMSDEKAIDLIFASGLSTARVISDISGRGVGMDIVRINIERLNGSIEVKTWPGRGTQFRILLPLTLAIVPVLLVRSGPISFGIPLVMVTETLRVSLSGIQTIFGRSTLKLREQVLPIYRLSELFDLHWLTKERKFESIVIIRSGKLELGLIVDTLIGQQEIVVKSLSPIIGEVTGISSAAILGDGRVALIIDVQGLFRLVKANQNSSF